MDFKKLSAIYNTLCDIETKGESTILMGVCLQTIRDELKKMVSEQSVQDTDE